MVNPMVGGIFVTVIFLTPGKNRSLVSVISGVPALGRAPAGEEDLAGEVFWAIMYLVEIELRMYVPSNEEVD